MKNNSACGKIVTIHDVPNTISLKDLQKKIRDKVPNCSIRAGLFWLPKRGKQGRALETEGDSVKQKTNIRMQMGSERFAFGCLHV